MSFVTAAQPAHYARPAATLDDVIALQLQSGATQVNLPTTPAGKLFRLTFLLKQPSSGAAGTATWATVLSGGTVSWVAGSAPSLSGVASAVDVVTLASADGGLTWVGWSQPPSAAWYDDFREQTMRPSSLLYETIPRFHCHANTLAVLTSGTLFLMAIALPAGVNIGHLVWQSGGTAAGTPTHWWFGLYDNNRNQLATTADQTSTAWAASTQKSLAIATTAAGAATSFTTTYSGLYYLGIMMVATTVITLCGNQPFAGVTGLSPALCVSSDTGQTTPPAFAHVASSTGSPGFSTYAGVAA